jgi:dolichyl-phosphate-mannose--protein O-mannosyl transferase
VLYLYHYFPALILSWGLFALVVSEALERLSAKGAAGRTVIVLAVSAQLTAFWFWSPLTFGHAITASACRARNVLAVQVVCRSTMEPVKP